MITGKGIKIAIFDTGLTSKRMHFRNVVVERDYTNENSLNDRVGHGTFVAGIISGINRRCPGIAPDAQLYIYKVFEGNQVPFLIFISMFIILKSFRNPRQRGFLMHSTMPFNIKSTL